MVPRRTKRRRKLKVDQMFDNSKNINAEKKKKKVGLPYNCAHLIVNDNVTTVGRKQEGSIMGGNL